MLERLIDLIKRRQAELVHALGQGHAANFESYQRLVGQIAGLQEALDSIDVVLREDDEREL